MSSRGDPPPPGGNRYPQPTYPPGSHPQAYHYAVPAQPILPPPPPPPGAAPGGAYQQRGRHRPPEGAYPAPGEPWQQRSKPYDPSVRASLSATAAAAHSEAAGSQHRSQEASSQPPKEQLRPAKRDAPIPGVALPSPLPGSGAPRSGAAGTGKGTGGASKCAGVSSAPAKGASTAASHNPFAVFATMGSPLPSPSPTPPPPGAATAAAVGAGADRPLSVEEVEALMRQQQQQAGAAAAAKDKKEAAAPAADKPGGLDVLSMLFGGQPTAHAPAASAASDSAAPANGAPTALVQRYSAETLRELNDRSLPPPAGFQAPPMLEARPVRIGEGRPEWAASRASGRRPFASGPPRYATARRITCGRHPKTLNTSLGCGMLVRVQAPAWPRARRRRRR